MNTKRNLLIIFNTTVQCYILDKILELCLDIGILAEPSNALK